MKTQNDSRANMNTAKQNIRKAKRNIWMKEWSETENRNIFNFRPSQNPNDSINQLLSLS